MGLISGFIKYKAIKNGIQFVKEALRKKDKKPDPAVKPYRTRATY